MPLVSVEETAGEWAAQEPLPEHGRNPYTDRAASETAVQDEDGITGYRVPDVYANERPEQVRHESLSREPGDVRDSPYASPMVTAELSAEMHHAVLIAPTSLVSLTDPAAVEQLKAIAAAGTHAEHGVAAPVETHGHEGEPLPPAEFAREVAQAVSVAAAYFEDTLALSPEMIASAGSLSASGLQRILTDAGLADAEGLRVRELVTAEMLAADAVSAKTPRGSLAGVLGALRG